MFTILATRGELDCHVCHDVVWENNIGWAVPGTTAPTKFNTAVGDESENSSSNPRVTWSHNLTFNGMPGNYSLKWVPIDETASFLANNPLAGVNPQLTNVPGLDFHPLAGSPVIGAGISVSRRPRPSKALRCPTPHIGGYNPATSGATKPLLNDGTSLAIRYST
jgi:hypothetical protein